LNSVVAVDVTVVPVSSLSIGILGLQVEMDRLRILQARWVRNADEHRIWETSGHRDVATWLAAKGKTSVRAARGTASLGAALAKHGAVGDAADAGDISAEVAEIVAAVLECPHSGDEADLLAAVKGATPVDAKAAALRFVELNHPDRQTPLSRENERRARRYLAFPDNADGTHSVVGNLPDADARTVETALASIAGKPGPDDHRSYGQRLADALVQLCDAYSRGEVKGGRSNLPTLLVVIDVDDLNGATDGPGYTSRGDVISAEAVRRLVWNADIARILMNDSVPLDLGRAQRLASNDHWRSLAVRDGGCRMADCHIPAEWCQVDHIQEWGAEHGPTDVDLLVLWCTFHHSFRHRKDVALIGDANDLSMRTGRPTRSVRKPGRRVSDRPATECPGTERQAWRPHDHTTTRPHDHTTTLEFS
jgi:hypothetical protein